MNAVSGAPRIPISTRHFGLHGLGVDVLGASPEVLQQVQAVLTYYGLTPVSGSRRAEMVLQFFTDPRAVQVPPGARLLAEHAGIRAMASDALYLVVSGQVCRVNISAGAASFVVPLHAEAFRKDLLIYSLSLLLRRQGFYALHGSCVCNDTGGMLFVAPSGCGKSTHTYSLVRQGWAYVGDDAVLLRAHGETVAVLAFRRDLCIDPELARSFPEIRMRGTASRPARKGKLRVSMEDLYGDRLADRTFPRYLVFPEIVADAPSRIVPLGPAETLMRVVSESVTWTLDDDVIPVHLQVLTRLVRQVRAFRLLAGPDLHARPEAVSDLLLEILP